MPPEKQFITLIQRHIHGLNDDHGCAFSLHCAVVVIRIYKA